MTIVVPLSERVSATIAAHARAQSLSVEAFVEKVVEDLLEEMEDAAAILDSQSEGGEGVPYEEFRKELGL